MINFEERAMGKQNEIRGARGKWKEEKKCFFKKANMLKSYESSSKTRVRQGVEKHIKRKKRKKMKEIF